MSGSRAHVEFALTEKEQAFLAEMVGAPAWASFGEAGSKKAAS